MGELRTRGIEVIPAQSTAEAVARFDPARVRFVVSDMGRYEGRDGAYASHAGLELLSILKERHPEVRLLFYTSDVAAAQNHDEALAAGALGIVSDPREVLGLLGL